MLAPWKKSYDKLSILKSRHITSPTKVCIIKAMVFSVVTYGCESWTIKAECRRIDAFKLWCWRRLLQIPLDCKEVKPVNSKGHQPWIITGRTDAEAEAPILRPPDVKSQRIRKDPDAGKAWGQEKRATEDEVVGWHYRLHEHEFQQTPGDITVPIAQCNTGRYQQHPQLRSSGGCYEKIYPGHSWITRRNIKLKF